MLRWSLEEPNGKDFRVDFEDRATGSTALLTGSGVPSGSSELVLDSQALATPCGTLSLTQGTAPTFPDETPESLGSEVPSVFDLQVDPIAPCPGGEDPPPEPETTLVERFHHRDHLGTVRVVTDEAGWVVASLDFYPFGLQMGDGDGQTRREYTGHERDEATGLDYMKARYKAVCGTGFASPDPIFDTRLASPTSWNRYAYVHGDPVNSVDPLGLNDGPLDPGFTTLLRVTAFTPYAPPFFGATPFSWWLSDPRVRPDPGDGLSRGSSGNDGNGSSGDSRPVPVDPKDNCRLSDCLKDCALDQFGIRPVVSGAGWGLGLPLIKTRAKSKGSTAGTSVLSKYVLPRAGSWANRPMRKPVWAPTWKNVKLSSKVITRGRVVTRWVPWVGAALLISDGVDIGVCAWICSSCGE